VIVSGIVAASLSVIWIRRAMTLEKALTTLEAPLCEVAARISGSLDAQAESADGSVG
jgi:hypothetical protein